MKAILFLAILLCTSNVSANSFIFQQLSTASEKTSVSPPASTIVVSSFTETYNTTTGAGTDETWTATPAKWDPNYSFVTRTFNGTPCLFKSRYASGGLEMTTTLDTAQSSLTLLAKVSSTSVSSTAEGFRVTFQDESDNPLVSARLYFNAADGCYQFRIQYSGDASGFNVQFGADDIQGEAFYLKMKYIAGTPNGYIEVWVVTKAEYDVDLYAQARTDNTGSTSDTASVGKVEIYNLTGSTELLIEDVAINAGDINYAQE